MRPRDFFNEIVIIAWELGDSATMARLRASRIRGYLRGIMTPFPVAQGI